jgi:hypothetical protein
MNEESIESLQSMPYLVEGVNNPKPSRMWEMIKYRAPHWHDILKKMLTADYRKRATSFEVFSCDIRPIFIQIWNDCVKMALESGITKNRVEYRVRDITFAECEIDPEIKLRMTKIITRSYSKMKHDTTPQKLGENKVVDIKVAENGVTEKSVTRNDVAENIAVESDNAIGNIVKETSVTESIASAEANTGELVNTEINDMMKIASRLYSMYW